MATAPLVLLLLSLIIGGGPANQSADDAVIGMAARDASRRPVLLGPYSRYGWHHLGPTYLYILGVPTRLWGGSPTGTWIGAATLAAVLAAAVVLALRRWGGTRAGWWGAVVVVLVVCGVGAGAWRDPWNPYAVVFPVLFTVVAAALAGSGSRGAFVWAAVAGSLAVQTHVSTLPIVVAALGLGAIGRLRHRFPIEGPAIPSGLPPLGIGPRAVRWWRQRPDLAAGGAILVLEWVLPLWDEAFGTHNLSSVLSFFATRHPGHPLGASWRIAVSLIGVTLGQHHAAMRDGVLDRHPLLTTLVYLALAAVGVVAGIKGRRPLAVWLGAMSALALVIAVWSISRIVGPPYKYLLVWITALPALPVAAASIGISGVVSARIAPDRPLLPVPVTFTDRVMDWLARPGAVVTALAVAVASIVGLRAALQATPAAALTNPEISRATGAVAPVMARVHGPVRFVINDGARWSTAAGMGLQLERMGHPMHADAQWTFLFGGRRRATGREEAVIVVAGSDPASWPLPSQATQLAVAGPARIFVARRGPACWWGWVPFGGPACPLSIAPRTAGPPPLPEKAP